MAKRGKLTAKDMKYHTCILVDDEAYCIDAMPPEERAKIEARIMEKVIPIMHPGYKAVLDPSCYDLDITPYLTPECRVTDVLYPGTKRGEPRACTPLGRQGGLGR